MNSRNIFDDPTFFENYRALRETEVNYNDQLEQPAMRRLLPDLGGKTVLDLGCGFGHNCLEFVRRGASRVIGLDLSRRMLDQAEAACGDPAITYLCRDMTDLTGLPQADLIYSSLAFHYVQDFGRFAQDLFAALNPGGWLLFSQEHPLVTATPGGLQHYNRDEHGKEISFTFSDYGRPGRRECFWFVDGVEKFHRRLSDIVTPLCRAGFRLDEICEPLPGERADQIIPGILRREEIKPTFLIVKAQKPGTPSSV